MNSFGATLKREREARGISLQQISANTKIGVRLLKAIEEEQLEQLPGGIFDKSFLRQYARYLGLDEDQILSEYLQAIGAVPEPPAAPPPQEMNASLSSDSVSRGGGYVRLILTAVLVGMVVAAVFYAVRQFTLRRAAGSAAVQSESAVVSKEPPPPVTSPPINSADTTAAPSDSQMPAAALPSTPGGASGLPAIPSAAPSGGIEKPLPPAPATSSPIQKAAPPATPPATEKPSAGAATSDTAAAALVLQIEARKDCWVSISADGQKQWQGTLLAERSRRAQARDFFQLTIGDAGAVTLTLNGKPLPPVGRSGEVKTLTISAKGVAPPEP